MLAVTKTSIFYHYIDKLEFPLSTSLYCSTYYLSFNRPRKIMIGWEWGQLRKRGEQQLVLRIQGVGFSWSQNSKGVMKNVDPKTNKPKQAEAWIELRDGVITPQNYNFNQFLYGKILMLPKCHVKEVVYHRGGTASYRKKFKTLYSLIQKYNEKHKNLVE